MKSLDYWRLCDELSVNEAANLLIGSDPNEVEAMGTIEHWLTPSSEAEHTMRLSAATTAISYGLRSGLITGIAISHDGSQLQLASDDLDVDKSRVMVESLKNWLISRGIRTGFFFPVATDAPEYLDPNHQRYAPKLAAAVRAWQAVTDEAGKSPKQALTKWLRENAALFGMTNDDGLPIEQAIEDVGKVANWRTTGGAPKTPGG